MATQNGLVIESKNGWAQVVTEKRDACGGCSSSNNCRTCLSASKIVSKVQNPVGAKEGDLVAISMSSRELWQGAALMYLLPVAALMLGAITGLGTSSYLEVDETLASAIGSILGLGMGLFMLIRISKFLSDRGRFIPVISKTLK